MLYNSVYCLSVVLIIYSILFRKVSLASFADILALKM